MRIKILSNPDDGEILAVVTEADFGRVVLRSTIVCLSLNVDDEPENESILIDLFQMRWKEDETEPVYTVSSGQLLKDGEPITLAENPEKKVIRDKYVDSIASIETMKTIDLSTGTVAKITAIMQGTTNPDRPGIAEILEFILKYLKYSQINSD